MLIKAYFMDFTKGASYSFGACTPDFRISGILGWISGVLGRISGHLFTGFQEKLAPRILPLG